MIDFQRELIKDLTALFSNISTKDTLGKTVKGVKGYPQRLPIVESDEEDESQFFPYFIVRISEGNTPDDDTPWLVAVDILFGIYDNTLDVPVGSQKIMIMCERLINHFAEEPLLAKKYRAEQDIEFALQDEDTHPYYFGGVRIKFNIPKVARREPDYG